LTDRELVDPSLPEKTYLLRRWGLWWVIIGFLVLLQELFGLNFFLIAMALVLIGVAAPRTKRQTRWIRSVLEYAGYLVVFIIVFYGLIWFSKALGLNTGMVLSATSLAIGILLQIWAEIRWQSESSGSDAVNRLIDKVRHL